MICAKQVTHLEKVQCFLGRLVMQANEAMGAASHPAVSVETDHHTEANGRELVAFKLAQSI